MKADHHLSILIISSISRLGNMVGTYFNLEVVKLVDYRVEVSGGYILLNGFALFDTAKEELVRMGRNAPYLPAGKKKACEIIVLSGLIGEPLLYVSSEEQRKSIRRF